jgi:hypothetical protein
VTLHYDEPTFGYWVRTEPTRILVRTAILPPDDFDGWTFTPAPTGLLTVDLAAPTALPDVPPLPPGAEIVNAVYNPDTARWERPS